MKFPNKHIFTVIIAVALVLILAMSCWSAGTVLARKGFKSGTSGYESDGGNVVVKTSGGVATATITAATGELTGTGPKFYASVPLGATANTTTYTGVFIAHRAMTITKASIAYVAKPASSAGTVTFALTNYDLSATTDDNLLSTATIDLEGLTNKTTTDLTLTETGADLVLADGDYLYATIVSNNADMTGATGGVLTLEYTLQ